MFRTPEDVRDTLLQYLGHIPTSDQWEMLGKVSRFLTGADNKDLFVLRGYAGTGKTSLISTIVKARKKLKQKVALMAPTGRAAKVMSYYSGFLAFTIHKQIYKAEHLENGMMYDLALNSAKDTLFIVDEASMIGHAQGGDSYSDLLRDLVTYVYSGVGCKLMLVGDVTQLPPVGMELSPALTPIYFRDEFGLRIEGYELKEVVRQKNESGILKNATFLREVVEMDVYNEFKFDVSPIDVNKIDGVELQEELESCYSNFGEDDVILITRSNKRANLFNQQIRARILWKEEEIAAGDLLMVVKNNYMWLDKKSKVGFIANGDTVEVLQVKKYEDLYGFRFADLIVKFQDYPDEPNLEVKILLDTLTEESPSLAKEKYEYLYVQVLEDYNHVTDPLMRRIKLKSDPYLNALQVKYAYALTCHKSQGGQWSSVFIDQGYLTEDMMNKEWFRWLYTAFTRATNRVYLLNFQTQFFEEE